MQTSSLQGNGKDWMLQSGLAPEMFELYPGLKDLTDRELDCVVCQGLEWAANLGQRDPLAFG